jgi:hypothetical protein
MVNSSNRTKKFHSGFVKKSVIINAQPEKVWNKVSNIFGLGQWVIDIKKTLPLSKSKRGVGTIRKIIFNDGNIVEEHVVAWKNKSYFSYIAVSGLPLRVYHATISMQSLKKKSVKITWQSYLNSKKMTKKEFSEFVTFLEKFYQESLMNLKSKLES